MRFVCPQTATAICIPASATDIIPSQPQNTIVENITFESPSCIEILPVRVFDGCISLKSICIPTSVTKIHEAAFSHCHSLSIVFFESPSSVIKFEFKAFSYCTSLESISIPRSLIDLGDFCFEGDRLLSEITFESPSQLTSIGYEVFSGCSKLSYFDIPRRLQIIEGTSFSSSSIIDVEVDPENQWFGMVDSYLINYVMHSIVRSFSDDSSAVVSNTIHELGSFAFAENVSLTTVTFESPSIVVKFLSLAFSDCCSLESICIPSSVRFIGSECFGACKSLISVTFEQPSQLEVIYDAVFNSCELLTHISIPASIQQIGSQCFVCCESLTSITFESPSNLTILYDLGDLKLSSIDIPDSVEVIRGMTTSSTAGSFIVSFGSQSKLSAVYPRRYAKQGIGAFVRYPEATLRQFRANVDYFAQGADAQI
jgi:hypothetical protein